MDSKFYIENLDFNIYGYSKFSDLLYGYMDACKQKDKRFSQLKLAKTLGLRSKGGFQRILEQKNLTKYLTKLRFLMNLDGPQWEYLSLLSEIEYEPENSQFYQLYRKRLDEVLYHSGNQSISEAQLRIANSWWHFVILEMVSLKGCRLQVQWFLEQMDEKLRTYIVDDLQEDEVHFVKTIIEDLKKAQLLTEKDGKPIINENINVNRISRNFYLEQFDIAKKCLYNPPAKRRFRGFLYSTTPEKVKLFKKKVMDNVYDQIDDYLYTSSGKGTVLVNVDFSLFQLSEIEK